MLQKCFGRALLFMAGLAILLLGSQAFAHSGEQGCVSFDYSFDSVNHSQITLTLNHFDQNAVQINGKEYQAISLDQGSVIMYDQVGHPQLPALCQSLMIPDMAKMEAVVTQSNYYEIDNVDLVPHRGAIIRSVDPSSVPYTFGRVYQEDAWFPRNVVNLRAPYVLRDVRAQVVELFPIQYNPVKRVLRVHTQLVVDIAKTAGEGLNPIDRSTYGYKPDRSFDAMYRSQFPNYGVFRTEPPSEYGDMLVISHGPFMANMQPFIDWKNGRGINTTMVDVATIGNNPTSIAAYITSMYNAGNLAYVLLVGDHTQVRTPDYQYGPSDPTYSVITADWYPDVFVGRFSANNTDQVDTQVQRTLDYECVSHETHMGGWNARGLGIASNQGPGHHGEYDNDHEDLIRDELLAHGFTAVESSYDNWGTKTIITNAINNGVLTVNYTGHGGPTGWGNGGGFSNSDVHALTNVGMLPFITGVACNCGEFDYTECFGEAWQWATHNGQPTGSVANYHSSISQSWDPPMTGQGNHAISSQYGAIDRFWAQVNSSVGGCFFGGSCIMMDVHGTGGKDMFMTWIIFGDPSLKLLGDTGPVTLSASGSTIPINTATTIDFSVKPGSDYAGYWYGMLGGMHGTYPGFDMPGPNQLHVPLNLDNSTFLFFNYYGTSLFQNFYGVLDGAGEAVATMDTTNQVPFHPRMAGKSISWVAVIWEDGKDYTFATNPWGVTFIN